MSDSLDLNKLADQLARGLAREQLDDEVSEPALGAVGGALGGAREAVPRGVSFASSEIRLGDVLDVSLPDAAATPHEVDAHCQAALKARASAVIVSPYWVSHCAAQLGDSNVGVIAVVGFPFGMLPPAAKASQAALAIAHGATELESIAPVGILRSRDWSSLYDDVEAVVSAADGAHVTVTVETSRLTPMEMLRAAAIVGDAGADAVKAGTGFGDFGLARVEAVALLRLAVGDDLGVKASAGQLNLDSAWRLLANGATGIAVSQLNGLADERVPGPRPLHELMQATLSAAVPAPAREAARPTETPEQQPEQPRQGSGFMHPGTATSGPNAPYQAPAPHTPPMPHRVTPGWGTSQTR